MKTNTKIKIIKLASRICEMHGDIAGDRICQDWSGGDCIDILTDAEKNEIMRIYEQFNSGGDDYEDGMWVDDEMVISYAIGECLEHIVSELEGF